MLAIAIGRASDELDLVQPIGQRRRSGGRGGPHGRLYRGGSLGSKRENGEPTEMDRQCQTSRPSVLGTPVFSCALLDRKPALRPAFLQSGRGACLEIPRA